MSTRYENTKNSEVNFTRFYGGESRGVCLQLTKVNNFTAEPVQLTLSESVVLRDYLKITSKKLPKLEGFTYKLQDQVYLSKTQLLYVINDLTLFILDPIHDKDNP